jgi:glycerol-3-phosphate dehydrogenase
MAASLRTLLGLLLAWEGLADAGAFPRLASVSPVGEVNQSPPSLVRGSGLSQAPDGRTQSAGLLTVAGGKNGNYTRQRGYRAEAEWCKLLTTAGVPTKRHFMSGMFESGDCTTELPAEKLK